MKVHNKFPISCILPTRGQKRKPLLFKCLESFYSYAKDPDKIEFIIVMDLDDKETVRDVQDFLVDFNREVRLVVQRRDLSNHSVNYVNYAVQCSTGDIIWGLNDECEQLTQNWDQILYTSVYPQINRSLYVLIDEETNIRSGNGSCFPILTRKAANIINGMLPKEISMWNADIYLYRIFQHIPDSILDLSKEIKIRNNSYHAHIDLFQAEEDCVGQTSSHKTTMTINEVQWYVKLLQMFSNGDNLLNYLMK